jgi:hypothetical protein
VSRPAADHGAAAVLRLSREERCRPERMGGIPMRNFKVTSARSLAPLRFAQDDRAFALSNVPESGQGNPIAGALSACRGLLRKRKSLWVS